MMTTSCRRWTAFVIGVALLAAVAQGCCTKCPFRPKPEASAACAPERVGQKGILYRGVTTKEPAITPNASEQAKKEVAERLDTAGLLYTGKVVVDKDPKMLVPPEVVAEYAGTEYIMAAEPPEVEFAVIPVKPQFLGETPR